MPLFLSSLFGMSRETLEAPDPMPSAASFACLGRSPLRPLASPWEASASASSSVPATTPEASDLLLQAMIALGPFRRRPLPLVTLASASAPCVSVGSSSSASAPRVGLGLSPFLPHGFKHRCNRDSPHVRLCLSQLSLSRLFVLATFSLPSLSFSHETSESQQCRKEGGGDEGWYLERILAISSDDCDVERFLISERGGGDGEVDGVVIGFTSAMSSSLP